MPLKLRMTESTGTPLRQSIASTSLIRQCKGCLRRLVDGSIRPRAHGFREALRIIAEEGLEARFARHMLNHRALVAGVGAMGLSMLVSETERLPMLNTVCIPDGADDKKVRGALLKEFGIETSVFH